MTSDRVVQLRWFRVLAGAYAVSSYGSFLNLVALNLFAYTWTGSAFGMGLLMVVRLATGSLCGLVAPRLIARFSYKQVLLWTNMIQAVVLGLLVVSPAAVRTGALFAVAVAGGCGNTLFMVALRSAVPELVGQDRRTWANSLLVTGRSLAMIAGFASAGLVVSLGGYSAAFLVDAATFAVCAAALAPLRFANRVIPPDPRPTASVSGARTVLLLGGTVLAMIGLRAVDAFGSASHNAALPVYSTLLNPGEPAVFIGEFLSCWALGNIVVQQIIQRYAKRRGTSAGLTGFTVGTVLMSGAFILGFAGLALAVTLVIAFLAGCADGFTEVSYTNHLQTLPADTRDRAFGLSAAAENLGFGVGMATNAVLLDRYAPLPVVAGSHGIAIGVALVFLFLWGIRARRGELSMGKAGERVAPTHRDHRDGSALPGS